MPAPSESSGIVVISSPPGLGAPESPTYDTLITSTVRRSSWFMVHIGALAGQASVPLARYDIATGLVGEEIDLIPDLGIAMTGGTGNAGTTHITTSFPFVIEAGVRLSTRIRSPSSVGITFNVDIRLIQ